MNKIFISTFNIVPCNVIHVIFNSNARNNVYKIAVSLRPLDVTIVASSATRLSLNSHRYSIFTNNAGVFTSYIFPFQAYPMFFHVCLTSVRGFVRNAKTVASLGMRAGDQPVISSRSISCSADDRRGTTICALSSGCYILIFDKSR